MTDPTSSPLPLAVGARGGGFLPRNTPRARELRNQPSPAERRLWRALSRGQLSGFKFSRQMPIGPYFADFLCRTAKLVVELDGNSHDARFEYDTRRDQFLTTQGFTVLRFNNTDVMDNLQGVLQTISVALVKLSPSKKSL